MRARDADELLGRIANKSQDQVEQELARENPKPKKRETVRRFAAKPTVQPASTPDIFTFCAPSSAAELRTSETHPKGMTLEGAFEELLDSFLTQKTREPRPRKAKAMPEAVSSAKSKSRTCNKTTRHIPAATRRAVIKRDQGKCTYTGPTGTRCNSTHDIELDHIQPWSANGTHDLDNLRVLCATHHRHRNLTMKEPTLRYSTSAAELPPTRKPPACGGSLGRRIREKHSVADDTWWRGLRQRG